MYFNTIESEEDGGEAERITKAIRKLRQASRKYQTNNLFKVLCGNSNIHHK